MKKFNASFNWLLIICLIGAVIYLGKQTNQLRIDDHQQAEIISNLADKLDRVQYQLEQTAQLAEQSAAALDKLKIGIESRDASIKGMTNQLQALDNKVASLNRFTADSIQTKRFALTSPSGKERIIMKSYPERTFMMLKSEDGLNSIYFNVHDDGRQSISFRGQDGRAQIGIKTDENGIPEITVCKGGSFTLRSKNGHHEVIKITESEGLPEIGFYEAVCNGPKIWSTNDWWLDRPESPENTAE